MEWQGVCQMTFTTDLLLDARSEAYFSKVAYM